MILKTTQKSPYIYNTNWLCGIIIFQVLERTMNQGGNLGLWWWVWMDIE